MVWKGFFHDRDDRTDAWGDVGARSTAGKFGKALSFNGTSARVNVNDSNSLDLTTAMTLEARVNPASASNVFRTIILKERTGQLVYALYSSTGNGRPDTEAMIGARTGRWQGQARCRSAAGRT